MAIGKITYDNKEAIQNDTSVPEKNKVTDANMNEIKQVINDNANELITTQNNIEDLQEGQGTANRDITSLKNKVTTLESSVANLESNKVDKVEGKGLSTEDFTNEYKQKLDDLENYDDTEIKQEQIQQNADIENLQINDSNQDSLISKLKQALINVETEQTKSLHIKDASTIPAQLNVEGNQEQEIREGYNLLDVLGNKSAGTTQTVNGVTYIINKDGSIKVNGTATDNADYFIAGNWGLTEAIIKLNGTYKLQLVDNNNTAIRIYLLNQSSVVASATNSTSLTKTQDVTGWFIRVNAGQTVNTTIYPQLVEGTEEKQYEQYGASPSSDYPSPIKCLGSNKQLFDKDNANILDLYINQDGNIYAATNRKLLYIECKENTNYTVSKIAGQYFRVGSCSVTPAHNVATINKDVAHETDTKIVLNSGGGAKYLVVGYYHAENDTRTEQEIIDSIKIEEGTEVTSYSPYRTRQHKDK